MQTANRASVPRQRQPGLLQARGKLLLDPKLSGFAGALCKACDVRVVVVARHEMKGERLPLRLASHFHPEAGSARKKECCVSPQFLHLEEKNSRRMHS